MTKDGRNRSRRDAVEAIYFHLERWPDDANLFLNAVSVGITEALQRERENASKANTAMLRALQIDDSKRLPSETRRAFYQRICDAINPNNASPIEDKFIKLAKGLSNDQG